MNEHSLTLVGLFLAHKVRNCGGAGPAQARAALVALVLDREETVR